MAGTCVSVPPKRCCLSPPFDLAFIIGYREGDNVPYTGHAMKGPLTAPLLPLPVLRALRKLGQDIRDARRRRRIPVAILAERASISRTTLNRIEKGGAAVSVGNYATVLFALGLVDRLAALADASQDTLGRQLEEEHLPERIRLSNPRKAKQPKGAQ